MLLYIYRLPIWQTLLFLAPGRRILGPDGGLLDSALPWGRRIWRSGCGVLAGVWLLAVLQATIFSRSPGAYEVCLAPLEQLRQALRGGNRELLRSAWMNVLLFIPGGLSLAELLPSGGALSAGSSWRWGDWSCSASALRPSSGTGA